MHGCTLGNVRYLLDLDTKDIPFANGPGKSFLLLILDGFANSNPSLKNATVVSICM